jgi:hypothetical protein
MTGILPKGGIPVSFLAERNVHRATTLSYERSAIKHKKRDTIKKMSLFKIYDGVKNFSFLSQ